MSITLTAGTNSTGPLNSGNGEGYYDGTLNGGHSCGSIAPTALNGANVTVIATAQTGGGTATLVFAVQGTVAQAFFTSLSFTGHDGILRTFATNAATTFGIVGSSTVWQWATAIDQSDIFGSGGTYEIDFMSFVTPSIVQDAPDLLSATEVALSWTPTIGTGPNAGVFTDMEVLRDGDPLATLAATATEYLDQSAQPSTAYTYRVQGTYSNVGFPLVVNTADQTVTTPDMTDEFNCDCTLVSNYATLAELRTRMLIRLGYPNQAANPPPGMLLSVDEYLRGAQKSIYRQLQRAALRTERFFRWTMVPGLRYYGIADSEGTCDLVLDPYKVTWVGFEDLNQAWYRLDEGIPPEYYTRANISFGWPTRYEIRSCIEIFPAPQAAYTLWIKGDFGLAPLIAPTDRCTIDDEAVFLLALGNMKADRGAKDAQLVLKQASNYASGLVAGAHGTKRYVPRSATENPLTPPKFLPLGDAPA